VVFDMLGDSAQRVVVIINAVRPLKRKVPNELAGALPLFFVLRATGAWVAPRVVLRQRVHARRAKPHPAALFAAVRQIPVANYAERGDEEVFNAPQQRS